jgi:hypothetical protein
MVGLDQSKLLITGVVLGFVLAVVLIRPQIFPQEERAEVATPTEPSSGNETDKTMELSYEELLELQRELLERETGLEERASELAEQATRVNQRQSRLDEREASLDQRETGLVHAESQLEARETELGRHEAQLRKRKSELNNREAALEQRKNALDRLETRLRDDSEYVESQLAAARKKEAHLAEEEQRLRGWRRFSMMAVILVGVLALLSLFASVAVVRKGREQKGVQDALAGQVHPKRQVPRQERATGGPGDLPPQVTDTAEDRNRYSRSLRASRKPSRSHSTDLRLRI